MSRRRPTPRRRGRGAALLTVVVWFLAAAGMTVAAPSLQEVGTVDDAAMLPSDSSSQLAATAVEELFPDDPGRNLAVIVIARPAGLTDEDRAFVDRVVREWTADPSLPVVGVQSTTATPDLASLLRSQDGAAELTLVELPGSPFEPASVDAVHAMRASLGNAPSEVDT